MRPTIPTKAAPSTSTAPDPCHYQCGAFVWRARFAEGDWRDVETATPQRQPHGQPRPVGHVALQFPLVEGAPIRAAVVRSFTHYRVHKCPAFVASARPKKVRP
jgi:hypothetical protein